jgi:2-dehydropantoate 2-reductase
MRFVVFGAGAIGGVAGARLHQAGHTVVLIARGPHYEAIRERGLTLETPTERAVLEIPVAESPDGLAWSGEEVVLLAVKSQDTAGALGALRDAAPAQTGPG